MTTTELTTLLTGLWAKVKSHVTTAINGLATKSELANYCPIIEDGRSSAVAAITGVAPFAILQDGQRIVLHFKYRNEASPTLQLTLSGGDTTLAYPLYQNYNSGVGALTVQAMPANSFGEFVYDATNSRWVLIGKDVNTTYANTTQTDINNSAQGSRLIEPKLLRTNFYLKSETNALVAGKQDKRTVERPTYTADWEYVDNGSPFTSQQLADELDSYYSDWRNEAAAATLYNALIEGNDASAVTLSFDVFGAFVGAGADLEATGYNGFIYQNQVTHNPSLTPTNYVKLGVTDSVSPTIANVDYTEADEFIFTFTCESASPTITLPQGVKLCDGFDWHEAAAGVKFQVSIQDNEAAYLVLTPNT